MISITFTILSQAINNNLCIWTYYIIINNHYFNADEFISVVRCVIYSLLWTILIKTRFDVLALGAYLILTLAMAVRPCS